MADDGGGGASLPAVTPLSAVPARLVTSGDSIPAAGLRSSSEDSPTSPILRGGVPNSGSTLLAPSSPPPEHLKRAETALSVDSSRPSVALSRQSSSVLPDLKLIDVLNNKTKIPVSRNCFKNFLDGENSVENLKFWLAAEKLRKLFTKRLEREERMMARSTIHSISEASGDHLGSVSQVLT